MKSGTAKLDIAIIGAGPAGIACAIAAVKKRLNVLLLDKGNVVDAIIRFPANMTFFSTTDQLELAGIPFTSQNLRPTRQETIKYYHALIRMFGLSVCVNAQVVKVNKESAGFEIQYHHLNRDQVIYSRFVILATGFFDHPNTLDVPGEDRPFVNHYYSEPWSYFNQEVVVIGGGNSAVEAVLDLYRSGSNVTLVHRGREVRESVIFRTG
jgi:thioredoxin reductase (NADPH)